MRQRLGIARTLINRPLVLFLDEPTLGLDPAGREAVLGYLATAAKTTGTSVVLCSHLLDDVERICDRVAIMHRAKLVANGSVASVVKDAGLATGVRVTVTPTDAQRAYGAIHAVRSVANISVDPARVGELDIVLADASGVNAVAGALIDEGIEIQSLVRRGARLSDAFLKFTEALVDEQSPVVDGGVVMAAVASHEVDPSAAARSGWRVVFGQELRDLWFGAKGLVVLLGYTVLLSVVAFLAASDADLNLLDARESVNVVVRMAIGLGALTALVVSADAISGERERGTLESILVTPLKRRDLVLGKLLSATTMWLAAMIVAIPYVLSLANGPNVTADALVTLLVVGSLVAAALTAMGMAISAIAYSNRVSLAASIGTLLVLAAPAQLPGVTSKGVLGSILIKANPVSAGMKLADELLVNQLSWASQWTFLISPAIAAVLLTGLAIAMASRLELGGSR